MAGKPRAVVDPSRSKLLSHAVQRLRNSRRARVQCCASFTVIAAALWIIKQLWANRLAALLAAEKVRHMSYCAVMVAKGGF
jgi:hypothetical protein